MAASQSAFSFFLPSRRRSKRAVSGGGGGTDPITLKALEGIDEVLTSLDAPSQVGGFIKDSVSEAFEIESKTPTYYPGAPRKAKFSLVDLALSPGKTVQEFIGKNIPGWDSLIYTDKDFLADANKEVWQHLYDRVWVDAATGSSVVSPSLQGAIGRWNARSAVARGARIGAEGLVRGNPGLTFLMAQQLERLDPSLVIGGVRIDGIRQAAASHERMVAGALARGDWAAAEAAQKRWLTSSEGYRSDIIRQFETYAKPGGPLANASAAQFWRYWKSQNTRFATLDLLRTLRDKGAWGAVQEYVWKDYVMRAVKRTLPYKALRDFLGGTALSKLSQQVFNLRQAAGRILEKYGQQAMRGLLVKLGLQKLLTWLGGAIGSIIPGVGNAVGAVIGAVVQFVGETLLKKIGVPAVKLVAYLLLGIICSFFVFAVAIVVLISSILSNTPYPWEAGGSAAEPQNLVRVEKKAALAGTAAFANPLKLPNGTHNIEWKITIKNISGSALAALSLSDRSCDLSQDIEEFAGGEQQEFSCTQTISGTDEIITNTASLALSEPALTEEGVGLIIIGKPPVSLPSGWPLDHGCLTQGPGASFSHGGAEAIDAASVAGDSVHATFTGVVESACWRAGAGGCDPDGYGNYVRVRALDGSFSAIYGHFSTISNSVKTGVTVSEGQTLGTEGTTGNSTGVHLHYQLWGLPMEVPYIPRDEGDNGNSIRGCEDSRPCNLCW